MTYEFDVDDIRVEFCVTPHNGDISLLLLKAGSELLRLSARRVDDVRIVSERHYEVLEIKSSGATWIRLRLPPMLEIVQECNPSP